MKFFDEQLHSNKLFKTLNVLNDIPYINHGGCLISCYAIWLKLKRPKNMSIMHLSSNICDINTNAQFLADPSKPPTSGNHFVVSFNGNLYDSSGVYINNYDYSLEIPYHKIYKFVKKSLKVGNWNSSFDRSEVDNINKRLKINISKKIYS